jgi:glycosidase
MTRIYEINTLPWLSELSEKYSKPISLANIPAGEWDRLEKLGFEYVWLMGLWERSKIGRRIALEMKELHPAYSAALPGWSPDDVAGSTYSIQAYRPDPDIGGWDALARLRNQLGRRGMGLILDLVCNHTGIDFPWVQKTPERYMQGNAEDHERDPSRFVPLTSRGRTLYLAKGRDPLFAPWQDTAQLNVFNPSTRRALGRLVTDIAKRCDGLRCDMAMLLLTGIFSQTWRGLLADPPPATEFWGDLIATHRRLLWIGEAYWDT